VDVGNHRQSRVPAAAPQVELTWPTCSPTGPARPGAPWVNAIRLTPKVGDDPRWRRHGVLGRLVAPTAPRYRRWMLEQDLALYTALMDKHGSFGQTLRVARAIARLTTPPPVA